MAYDATKPNVSQAYGDVLGSIRENFRALADGDTAWTVPKGGTGLTTIPAGRLMYGNDTSAISTSANLTYDGTNLGIGTTTPLSKLHVSGVISSFGANQGFLTVGSGTDFTNFEGLQCLHNGVHGAQFITSGVGTGTTRDFVWLKWDGTYATELMRLTASGDLGLSVTPSAALHIVKTTEQLRLAYDASNYQSVGVGSTGWLQFQHSGTTPYWHFTGSSTTGAAVQILLNNSNVNAYGAVINFQTETTTRGYIGALKHGSASDVLFAGETTDGFGIRAETVLEFGISSTGIGRWNTTGLAVGGLFTPLGRIDSRATSGAQLVASYDASNYAAFTSGSAGNLTLTLTGSAVPKAFATNAYIYSNFALGSTVGWTGTLTDFGSGAVYAMGAHVDSPDSVNLRVTGSVWGVSQETAITTTADANFQLYLSNPSSTYIQWRLGPLSRQNIIFHSDLNAAVSPMITAGAAVDDARHPNGTISFYIDEGANKLHFKVKYSGGTVKVGEVSLV